MGCSFQDFMDNFAFFIQMNSDSSCSCNASAGMHGFTVFVLACFVGYYVVWKVTPALHAPLMSVTNAISSVIIIGAIFAAAQYLYCFPRIVGFIAIILASINIFGGFTITHRMLGMFRKNR
jgi:NAD(P) transhydrogenase subunit alpha